MPWVDGETGEVLGDTCPTCVGYSRLEMDLRNYRARVTRLENEAERNVVAKRDGKVWKELLTYWEKAFPEKRITGKSVKSARATKVFQRLESGATPQDIRHAIDGATVWRWVTFGRRTKAADSRSKLAVDLEHIVSIGTDAQFDFLVEKGRAMTKEAPF